MAKRTAKKIPLWKLLIAINAMIEEGCAYTNITVEDDETVSFQATEKEEIDKKETKLPDINQFEL